MGSTIVSKIPYKACISTLAKRHDPNREEYYGSGHSAKVFHQKASKPSRLLENEKKMTEKLVGGDWAKALGRIPSGLFILTAKLGGSSTGMLASWIQQVSFEPPMVTVAVRKGRFVAGWLEQNPYFCLNQLGQGQKDLLKHFGAGFDPDAQAFSGQSLKHTETHQSIVLESAMSFMECHMIQAFTTSGDHDLIVAQVISGGILNEELEPSIHLRKSGLHY
jgi:flavin reductase (DIM6/NTAB) family NADH-FMN oxidoreductase RutF